MLLRSLLVLLTCLSLAFAATPTQAMQVQLAWDAPVQADGTPVPNLAGYKLYVGSQTGQYQTTIPVGLTTTYTVTNVSAGQTYYFAVKAYDSSGTESAFSNEVSVIPGTISQQQIRVVSVDSQDVIGGNYAATNAIDGNAATFWHTEWFQQTAPLPHTLVLDLGGQYQVDGFRYLPRQDGSSNGTMAGYQFYVSTDGTTWGTAVAAGTLAADTTEKTVRFTAKTGRYVRLVALSEINGNPWTSAAELNVFGTAASSSTTTTNPLLAPSVTTATVTSSTSTSTTTTGKSTTPKASSTAVATSPSSTTTARQLNTQAASATVAALTSASSTPTMTARQNTRWELTLTSTKTYTNPFLDVTVTVEYTKAGTPSLHGYGFWDGDATFKLRQAFPEPGTWHYKTTATDPSNSGLHKREGDVQVLPYRGPNPLYRHGFLQVNADHRSLVHVDGTPFLWLGDTLWGATVWLTETGFHDAVADRRAKHFTVLQTNFAREDEVDTAGDTPWQGDRWNVDFMQKLDRMFSDANDQGMYLFVNGLVDLFWDRRIPHYERLVEMIGARYAAHYVSFASSMDDPYDPLHEQINAAIQRTAPRTLVTQHPGAATNGQGNVWTAEQYYDTPGVDYVMDVTGGEGDLEVACQHAIDWSLRLYNHVPPKPVVNGQAWYEGVAGGTAEMTAQLGYLSLLSGNVGYTYGTSLWNATDADLPAWKAFRGATYMQYLYDFFAALDEGRPFQPRHGLIKNQARRYQDRMVLGVSADGMTYAAFLPKGGTISVDLKALAGTTIGVTWYNPLTGQYHDQGTTSGGAVRSFVSPFGARQSALVLMVQ
jgi:fibronectin type 3 domain-containing protein